MRYFMLITLLFVQFESFAQDSISQRFASMYDAYRIAKGMNPLCYAPELDSFSTVRLAMSIEGTRECFVDTGFQCPGDRNLHFKFQPMASAFNSNKPSLRIIGENMMLESQSFILDIKYKKKGNMFTKLYRSICKFLGIKLEKQKPEIESIVRIPYKDSFTFIEHSMLNGWINSPDHNALLLSKEGTHYSFKIMETMNLNLRHIYGVFIMARRDTVQQSLSKK